MEQIAGFVSVHPNELSEEMREMYPTTNIDAECFLW